MKMTTVDSRERLQLTDPSAGWVSTILTQNCYDFVVQRNAHLTIIYVW
jgi:hypothetical protein